MKTALRKKWIEALRSDKYVRCEEGRRKTKTVCGPVDVLQRVANTKKILTSWSSISEKYDIPEEAIQSVNGYRTFKQVASYIERYPHKFDRNIDR